MSALLNELNDGADSVVGPLCTDSVARVLGVVSPVTSAAQTAVATGALAVGGGLYTAPVAVVEG